ncbi:hypothetical protein ABFT51_20745 [Paenibacillus peoriae]|uniref:hypothetical protein n=1 Tax=Paenibacillus peoriae TaxID=59893 RepID=UPI0032B00597
MRRSILFMICFAFAFSVLVGCTASTSSDQSSKESAEQTTNGSSSLFDRKTPYDGQFEYYYLSSEYQGTLLKDKVYGCEYINSGDFFIPRLNADGVPLCNNTKK